MHGSLNKGNLSQQAFIIVTLFVQTLSEIQTFCSLICPPIIVPISPTSRRSTRIMSKKRLRFCCDPSRRLSNSSRIPFSEVYLNKIIYRKYEKNNYSNKPI